MYQGDQYAAIHPNPEMNINQFSNAQLDDDTNFQKNGKKSQKPKEEITPEYVYDKYLSTKKNPIMILNEFCSRYKKIPDFKVDSVNTGRSKIFYTTIEIEGLGVLVEREPGKNKQVSKTNASHKAVSELINSNEKAREVVLELSKRALGEITAKEKFGQKLKEKRERAKEEKKEISRLQPNFQLNPNAFTSVDPYDRNQMAREGPNLLYEQFVNNN